MTATYQHLLVDIAGGIATVTISRPEVFNGTNNVLPAELTRIWRDLDADPAVRVIVVTGAGEQAFSAGGDLNDIGFRAGLSDQERFEATMRVMKEAEAIVYGMVNCEKVIISAINGVAVGAGLAVALMADISIIAEEARLTDGHARLGVAAGDHAAICWPLLCGMAKAKYYLLTCEPLTGEEAERIGLVSLCVDDDQVQARALAVAESLASGSQSAIRWTKHSLNNWYCGHTSIFDAGWGLEFSGFGGPDVAEGLASHREKRAPDFTGPTSE